eukprot:3940953-Rhodomonas_salina.2
MTVMNIENLRGHFVEANKVPYYHITCPIRPIRYPAARFDVLYGNALYGNIVYYEEVQYSHTLCCQPLSTLLAGIGSTTISRGTDTAMLLSLCYAMFCTDSGYAATRRWTQYRKASTITWYKLPFSLLPTP